MKLVREVAAILLLLLGAGVAAAEEPRFDFGFSGKVTITKATVWMDGGSVTVFLKDEHDHEARVAYHSLLRDHPGQCSYTVPAPAKPNLFFSKGGINERALADLLRGACLTTYHTDDPQQLAASKDWNQFAMSEFLRRLKAQTDSHAVKP